MLRTSLSHIFSDCFQASKLMTPGQPQLHLAQNFTGSPIIGGASHNFDILKMVKKVMVSVRRKKDQVYRSRGITGNPGVFM